MITYLEMSDLLLEIVDLERLRSAPDAVRAGTYMFGRLNDLSIEGFSVLVRLAAENEEIENDE